ncbi:Cysteine synthase [hydrothermal vent metagenome]|uniref:Cysteine synthase n=1 Tax=hydrothermal vent metagenome TaxID=652676 RepID=A0A3B0UUZ9_9ZZZZ
MEQQGKTVEELNAQWYDDNYWKSRYAKVDEWDEEIEAFNERTGVLKKYL